MKKEVMMSQTKGATSLLSPSPGLFGLQARLPVRLIDQQKLAQIVVKLRQEGRWVYRGKRSAFVFIDLTYTTDGDGRRVYLIPKVLQSPDLPLCIRCAEGRFGDPEEVVVCCRLNGTTMRPFWVYDSPHPAGDFQPPKSCHALFSVGGERAEVAITIRAESNRCLRIIRHSVCADFSNKLAGAWISSEEIYVGGLSRLPEFFPQYDQAARAAILKLSLPLFSVCYANRG